MIARAKPPLPPEPPRRKLPAGYAWAWSEKEGWVEVAVKDESLLTGDLPKVRKGPRRPAS